MPPGLLSSSRRSFVFASRGSPTYRYACASACGPRKSGFTANDSQSMRQALQLMQLTSWISSSMAAFSTIYSRSDGGTGSLFSSHGFTARCLSQNGFISQTRSRMIGIEGGDSTRVLPFVVNSASLLLHARLAWPLIHIAHEPQIALRQAQRTASEGS